MTRSINPASNVPQHIQVVIIVAVIGCALSATLVMMHNHAAIAHSYTGCKTHCKTKLKTHATNIVVLKASRLVCLHTEVCQNWWKYIVTKVRMVNTPSPIPDVLGWSINHHQNVQALINISIMLVMHWKDNVRGIRK